VHDLLSLNKASNYSLDLNKLISDLKPIHEAYSSLSRTPDALKGSLCVEIESEKNSARIKNTTTSRSSSVGEDSSTGAPAAAAPAKSIRASHKSHVYQGDLKIQRKIIDFYF